MSAKHLLSILMLCLIGFKANSQKQEVIQVFDFNKQPEIVKTKSSELDKDHPNLLNPEISKNETTKVRDSWIKLHQNIGKYLEANGFKWEVDDPEIMILHKFYFEPNGTIKTYFFRVFNEEVSNDQREAYAELITDFAKTHRIAITKDSQFAQCGKSKYVNP